ncbi:shikimate dehydrogenase [Cytobacillus sp. Hm23]
MTKLFGLIGCPVAHSLSPQMHNDAFGNLEIDAKYHAFHVEPENLENAILGCKALQIAGFNVTIPHKVSIMKYLDDIDQLAEQIGAVNTVVNNNGRLIGYNTDGPGYVRALANIVTSQLNSKKILIIGSGGAARGIYFSLAKHGVQSIDICNRTMTTAVELVKQCQFDVQSSALTIHEAETRIPHYDIIINTTSVGMSPKTNAVPISTKNINKNHLVSDIIYNPLETKLLTEARNNGAVVQNGVDMFVCQGALAFETWTSMFPNTDRMKKIVLKKLGGTTC